LLDGNWGQWTHFTSCSVTCGSGTQTRSRSCDNPAPSAGGLTCIGSENETKNCGLGGCPVGNEFEKNERLHHNYGGQFHQRSKSRFCARKKCKKD